MLVAQTEFLSTDPETQKTFSSFKLYTIINLLLK